MASNPQIAAYPPVEKNDLERPPAARASDAKAMTFSLSQVVVMWSVIAGTMIGVFMFGLFAGREQGLKQALEAQERFAMRLPLTDEGIAPTSVTEIVPTVVQPVPVAVQTPAPVVTPTILPNTVAPSVESPPAPEARSTVVEKAQPAVEQTVTKAKEASVPTPPTAVKEPTKDKVKPTTTAKITQPDQTRPSKGAPIPGWYVQVAAAKSLDEADRFVTKLRAGGLKVHLEETSIKNSKYYRVMSGPYTSQNGAQAAQKKIRDAKISTSTPFTKRVP